MPVYLQSFRKQRLDKGKKLIDILESRYEINQGLFQKKMSARNEFFQSIKQ